MGDDEGIVLARHEYVAFRPHGFVELQRLALQNLARQDGLVAHQINAHGWGGLTQMNAACLQFILQIVGCEAVFNVARGHNDAHAGGQRKIVAPGKLARLWDQRRTR